MAKTLYKLPPTPYGYDELRPYISEELLRIHHSKHHAAYVNSANTLLESLDKARVEDVDLDYASTYKQLSFNIGGHILHTLYWNNLHKPSEENKPSGTSEEKINQEFGSYSRFRKEFTQTALKTEGSGWAALTICPETGRLIIDQIEKHNINVITTRPIVLVVDVWEHAYYLDYRNDRAKYLENFWNAVNWDEVNKRIREAVKP